ncbi:hypothetical protein C0993_000687 [Termitomyces sp. T159_Od127]|nr:hypothetical protein C0993_000687 [Termitomyces sp. T159_Od127]
MSLAIGIWSLKLTPGKAETFQPPADLRITNAALGDVLKDASGRTTVKLSFEPSGALDDDDEDGGEAPKPVTTVLCSLKPDTLEQTSINLVLQEDETYKFELAGKNTVYLTGNYIEQAVNNPPFGDSDSDDDSDMGSDEDAYDLREVSSDVEMHPDDLDGIESDASRFEEVEEPPKNLKRAREADEAEKPSKAEKKKKQKTEAQAVDATPDAKKKEKEAPKEKGTPKEKGAPKEKGTPKEKGAPKEKEEKEKPKAVEKELAGGIKSLDAKVGTGPVAKKGNTVRVRYIGKLTNGKVFDKNVKGKPFSFQLGKGEVIKAPNEHRCAGIRRDHPGYRTLLAEHSALGNFLPKIPGITLGYNFFFASKHHVFEESGCDILSVVSVYPPSKTLILADAAAVKEIVTYRSRFPKPVWRYGVLSFFGRNIVASEGEEWKKYRKISAPAFSDRNNKMVWEETVKIVDSLFKDVWGDKETITTNHCVEITLPIALFVIGVAGFGRTISWKDDDVIPPGHRLTFKDALHIVSSDVFIKLLVPEPALGLTKRFRGIRLAFDELERYMTEMIHERQTAERVSAVVSCRTFLEATPALGCD